MLLSFIIAFFSAAGIYFVFHSIKQVLLKRLNTSEGIRVDTLVSVSGEAKGLEMLVRRLNSREAGGEIYLRCLDADEETALMAEKLAREGLVKIIN